MLAEGCEKDDSSGHCVSGKEEPESHGPLWVTARNSSECYVGGLVLAPACPNTKMLTIQLVHTKVVENAQRRNNSC